MPEVKKRTCHLCEANCGLLVEVEGREVLSIRGNPDHVLSHGYICPKATAIADLQTDPDRLRQPVKRVNGEWVEISWETAFLEIAARTNAIRGGGKSAAVYIGNPTAHNYLVSMQFKPFTKALGLRGIYSASTLDQLPHELIHKWVYGHRNLAPIADIDRTQYMVILGGNPAASNGSLWTVPGVKQRIKDLRARGGKLVVVDPRMTETAKLADEHHFIRPSGDIAFLLGLLLALDEAGLVKPGRLAELLDSGWAEAWSLIREFELGDLADFCGVPETAIRSIAAELGSGRPAILYGRMGTCVQRHGTVNQWLIQLINIATGNLDREGGVLFNEPLVDFTATTGGGTYDRFRTRVSDRPEVLGELPASELASEIMTPGEAQVGALFTVAGNPVLSSPGGRHLDAALDTLDLMVSVDMYINETTRHADYILPPCGPLEKDHYPIFLASFAVRNFACYSQPVFEKTSFDDGEIISQLTIALMGGEGSAPAPAASSRDALEAMVNASPRGVTFSDLEAAPDGVDFGPLQPSLPDRLKTEDQKIHCAPAQCVAELQAFRQTVRNGRADGLVAIGRRHLRSNNSWLHNSHRLVKGPNRCTVMMSPADARRLALSDGDQARVFNHVGSIELPVEVTEDIMPGVVSIPHGFGHDRDGIRIAVASAHAGASLNDLTDPAQMDQISGNAVLNGTPVMVEAAASH